MNLQTDWDMLVMALTAYQDGGGSLGRLAKRAGVGKTTLRVWLSGETPKTVTIGQAVMDVLRDS